MNLITLPFGKPRHHIGKLKGFAYLPFEAFLLAYVDAYIKLRVSSGTDLCTSKQPFLSLILLQTAQSEVCSLVQFRWTDYLVIWTQLVFPSVNV